MAPSHGKKKMKVMQMLLCDLPHVLSKMGKRKYSVKIHSESQVLFLYLNFPLFFERILAMKQKLKTTIAIMSMLFILVLAKTLRFANVEPEHGQVSAAGASIALRVAMGVCFIEDSTMVDYDGDDVVIDADALCMIDHTERLNSQSIQCSDRMC